MIDFESKKQHIDLALQGSSYYSFEEDRVRLFLRKDRQEMTQADEDAVQAILDAYDPLPKERALAKKRIIDEFEEATALLESKYPTAEKRLFRVLEAEARAYEADNQASTPALTVIATERGRTVAQIANRIIQRADNEAATLAALVGKRHKAEDQIDSASTFEQCRAVHLNG